MPEIDGKQFEADMKDLEIRIKVLRAEYNQYLNGTLRVPPNFTEAQIRKLVKRYAAAKGLKGIQRFQYFNLVAKFNTMMEFYGRRIRQRDQGLNSSGSGPALKRKVDPALKLEETRQKLLKSKGQIISDVQKQKTTIKKLFESWNESSILNTKPQPKLEFEKFKQVIQEKTDKMIKTRGCKAVRYKISYEKGTIRIKAKPVK